eukprot:CAMPEP_0176498758 /NCGR_PEP_ID=MMETSP0200_2-20121128/12515_1 /TAXON_ID=947934 /ORGANISM="Chaetoceros sp., Strain GSL56" /LENGTH=380 /DNA_ID=CAMNT_0017897033 /DNA_START=324 /DNA_END=1466 /DNA_ORIENTATION=+
MTEMKYVQSLPHPDMHADSFSSVKFFLACQRFMKICGNSDGFSFNDLGAPDKKRFRRQLSAAINFIKFREDRLVLYAELHDQREELLQGLQEVKGEKNELVKTLADAKQEAQKRWDEVKVIDADCEDMEAEIAQQNKLQRNLRGESEELKKQANRLKDKIATAELALQEMDAEERKLLPKIVDSPDELQIKIAELNVQLQQEKKRLTEAEGEVKVAETRIKNVTRAKADISGGISLMDELSEEKRKYSQILEEIEALKNSISANSERVEHLETLRQQRQEELDLIEKETEQNRYESRQKLEEVQSELRDASAQLHSVEKERRDAKSTLEQYQEDVRVLQTIIDEEQAKAKSEINGILSHFKRMEKTVLERQERFDSLLCV